MSSVWYMYRSVALQCHLTKGEPLRHPPNYRRHALTAALTDTVVTHATTWIYATVSPPGVSFKWRLGRLERWFDLKTAKKYGALYNFDIRFADLSAEGRRRHEA